MSSEQQPVKRKRIAPTPVVPLESGVSVAHAPSSGLAQQAPVDLYQGPITLPGRRMEADISRHYAINYVELLKKSGVDPKQLKTRQASSATEKTGKLPAGLPNLPGLPRAGASPGAGGKSMFGLVVDRLQRIYTSAAYGDDDDEDEEGEIAGGSSDDSGSHSSDSSGDSSNEADNSDDGSSEHSSEEPAQPEPDGSGGGGGGPGLPPTSGTERVAAMGAPGATSDGVSASSKKFKQRRRPVEAYEADFIDDDEELRYAKSRGAKAKYDGFFINQGAVELENDPEAEEEQRQAQKRGSRPRSQQAAQPAKAKSQQPVQGLPTGGAASTAAVLAAPAAAATTATGDAAGGAVLTPVRKRRVEGNQPQPAGKKRKQAQSDLAAAGPRSPGPAATSSAAQPVAPVSGTQQGLAALAAALGKSAGATAACLDGAVATAAPAGMVMGSITAHQAVMTAGGASNQQPVEAAAEPASAIAGSVFTRVSGRRQVANPASLEPVINDCRKKLAAAFTPPADWAALAKLLDTPLTQVALFLHRNHRGDPQGYEAGVALVARALAEAAPTAVESPSAIVELLQDTIQRRLVKSNNDLSKMVAAVKKLAGEVAAADAVAPPSSSNGGGGVAHSSDDEFTEPAGGSTASALVDALEAKLRSYLNLYRKLHKCEDESTTLQALAAQAGVGIDMLQRALLSAHSRPAGQRKRQGSKTAALGADDTLKQQAALIAAMVAAEVDREFGASAAAVGPTGGTPPGVAAAAAHLSHPTSSTPAVGTAATAAAASTVEPMEVGTEVFPGACGSQPEAHQFPNIEEDQQQRKHCRAALKSFPSANEELLERAFEAAASSEWATLAVKVLCHSSEGLLIPELAKRAVELRYIVWPNTKPIADMHRQLRQAVNRISLAPHVLHVGSNRYMLQAMRPDAKGVPRQPLPGRAGGSTSSSPAAAVGAAGTQPGGGSAFSAGAGAPVPFSLLGALPLEPAVVGTQGGSQQHQPAAVGSAGPDLGAYSSAAADAGAGGGGAAGGGIGEEELTQEEESQQCRDCIEAAVHAGADRQRVQETLSKLKSRNLRIVFKVLCYAGAAGMRVSDIVKFAREHRFVNWPDADRTSSIHGAIRTSKDMVVHVGTHQYALTLFPSVVPVPKPEQRRGARAAAAGGAAAGPTGLTGSGEGAGGDHAEA